MQPYGCLYRLMNVKYKINNMKVKLLFLAFLISLSATVSYCFWHS